MNHAPSQRSNESRGPGEGSSDANGSKFGAQLAGTRFGLLARHRWAIFVLPLLVYMLLGHFEEAPSPPPEAASNSTGQEGSPDGKRRDAEQSSEAAISYPRQYALRLAITIATVIVVLPGYREFPFRISWLAPVVGVVGVVLWVGLCRLDLETRLLTPLGLEFLVDFGERIGFNPFQSLGDRPGILAAFLLVRFTGLAVVVPLIEEFFLRGFLMRFVMAINWWKVPIGEVTPYAVFVGTAYGVLAHPAEMIAAAVWFTLVTGLMVKTRNIWDCVAAHAVTNLLLGIYVLVSGDWALW
jgi:CAAX prenyl protease-like protein